MLRETIRQFLRAHGVKLNTDLGQHFLVDETVLEKIVEGAAVQPKDHVVEIGPGIGVLTRELLKRAGHVTAIEIDRRFMPLLEDFIATDGEAAKHKDRLTIIHGNALNARLPALPYRIIANIPYHITSPLLRHLFLESAVPPASLTLLIQREVAEKIVDTEHAGLLTILVGLFGTPTLVATVPSSAFLPPPKVDSTILHIDCFPEPLTERETMEQVFRLTKMAFGQKRKMLRNTLGVLSGGRTAMLESGIAESRRPETLSVKEWISLAERTA